MNRIQLIEKISQLLAKTRTLSGKSRRALAMALCKSPTTICNWESGAGVPNIIEMLEWFKYCNVNIFECLIELSYDNFRPGKKTEQSRKRLLKYYLESASPQDIEKISFCAFETNNVDWMVQLNFLCCFNLLPPVQRITFATFIVNTLNLEARLNNTWWPICPDLNIINKWVQKESERIGQ